MGSLQVVRHRIQDNTRNNAKTQRHRSSLDPKKIDVCGIQESKTDSFEEIKDSPFNLTSLGRRGNKQLGMGFLVNESLKVTRKNLVNGSIVTLTITKKDKFKSISTPTGIKVFRKKRNNANSLSILFMPRTRERHFSEKAH